MAKKFENPIKTRPRAALAGAIGAGLLIATASIHGGDGRNNFDKTVRAQATLAANRKPLNLDGLYPAKLPEGSDKADVVRAVDATAGQTGESTPAMAAMVACVDKVATTGNPLGHKSAAALGRIEDGTEAPDLIAQDAYTAYTSCIKALVNRAVDGTTIVVNNAPPIVVVQSTITPTPTPTHSG